VVIKPPRPDDPVRRKPNIELAKKVLGWEPHTALRPGLEKSIKHFREVLGIPAK
jgi:UDP-glucuronate decarboxylase